MQTTSKNKRLCRGIAVLAMGAAALPLLAGGAAQAQTVVPIWEIQGAGHVSPYAGVESANRAVSVLLSELQRFLADQLGR